MNPQSLLEIEKACQALYEGGSGCDPRVQTLLNEYKTPSCIPQCLLVLSQSQTPYAQLFAATSLLNLATKSYTSIELDQRLEIKNFVLNCLWTNPTLQNVVAVTLMQLMARLTKFGWFDGSEDNFPFRETPIELAKFMQGTLEQCAMGIQSLVILITEINEQGTIRIFTQQRKISSSFRDISMVTIFELSLALMKRVLNKEVEINGAGERFLVTVLQLTLSCLTFDFIGTAPDDSVDDSAVVEIPSSWRQLILDTSTLQLLFDLYTMLQPPHKSRVLEIIVQMGSIRRSLFVKEERVNYLTRLVDHIILLLQSQEGLSDPACYHEICRLFYRLKIEDVNCTIENDSFDKLVTLIGDFTLSSISSWQYAANSLHYLLRFWSRLVSSGPPVHKSMPPTIASQYAPRIVHEFLQMRINTVEMVLQMKMEDPLGERDELINQLEKIATIARSQYDDIWQYLSSAINGLSQSYQEQVRMMPLRQDKVEILDRQLSWLVYTISCIIGGRTITQTADTADVMDGELACKVMSLIPIIEQRQDKNYAVLEFALLHFIKNFSKIYIGGHVQKTSKIFTLFNDRLGLVDQSTILHVFTQKIVTDLKTWSDDEDIIVTALTQLVDWSTGYSTVRMLLKLEPIQYILKNHTAATFPFLSQLSFMKARSTFFSCMGLMLFVTVEGTEDKQMEDFVLPFAEICNQLDSLFSNTTNENLAKNNEAKYAIMGMSRDLKGLLSAAHNKIHYSLLYNYLYPQATHLMLRAVTVWCNDTNLSQAVLKFLLEFVTNKNKRIDFEVSSANGILLFKESIEILSEYTRTLLAIEVTNTEEKLRRIKGLTTCLKILHAALSGKYTNFGVFRLYGDDTLDKAFGVFLGIIHTIPLTEMMTYPKMTSAYYMLLETLGEDHIDFLSGLESHAFHYMLTSLDNGIILRDAKCASQACTVLDCLLSSHLKTIFRPSINNFTPTPLAYNLEQYGSMLPHMLSSMLQAIMFEDCQLYWSLSRPMLCLILLDEKYFLDISREFLQSQAQERQAELQKCFNTLMEGIEMNLTQRNRDMFTKNINNFRREISSHIRTPAPTSTMIGGEGGIDMMTA